MKKITKTAGIQEGERYEIARKFESEGAFAEAIKIYQTIIKRNPIHIDAVSRLLILYRKTKDRDAEIEVLKNAVIRGLYPIKRTGFLNILFMRCCESGKRFFIKISLCKRCISTT